MIKHYAEIDYSSSWPTIITYNQRSFIYDHCERESIEKPYAQEERIKTLIYIDVTKTNELHLAVRRD